jgi:hypothetical protein
MRHTTSGKQHRAEITAPTLVSINAFMFENSPIANMVVYATNGKILWRSNAPSTFIPLTSMPTTTKALTASCAPDTTVGSPFVDTASLLMTSIVDEHREYTKIHVNFSRDDGVFAASVLPLMVISEKV